MPKQEDILEVIFPRSRAHILRLLFTKPKRKCYVRELAQRTGLALSSTQEELNTLVTAGLITAGIYADGCKRFYQANRNHPLFPHLLGVVHTSGRMRRIDVSNLRRVRRPKWKKRHRPESVSRRPRNRPMFRPSWERI